MDKKTVIKLSATETTALIEDMECDSDPLEFTFGLGGGNLIVDMDKPPSRALRKVAEMRAIPVDGS